VVPTPPPTDGGELRTEGGLGELDLGAFFAPLATDPAARSAWEALARAALSGADPEKILQVRPAPGLSVPALAIDGPRPRLPLRSGAIGVLAEAELHTAETASLPAFLADCAARGATELRLVDPLGGSVEALFAALGDEVRAGSSPLPCSLLVNAASDLSKLRAGLPGWTLESDPFGSSARRGAPVPPGTFAHLAQAVAQGGVRFAPSGLPFSESGAEPALELACLLASMLGGLRGLAPHLSGEDLAKVWSQSRLRISVPADQVLGLASLRALRLLLARLAELLELPPTSGLPAIIAVQPERTLCALDPWTNLLRSTVAAFVGICGGATAVCLAPFDLANGVPERQGRRLALQTAVLLLEEAHLGSVFDPGAGAFGLEQLTDELARSAWGLLQQIEEEGGLSEGLATGRLQARVQADAARQQAEVDRRRRPLVGASVFPDLHSPPLVRAPRPQTLVESQQIPLLPSRLSSSFEALVGLPDPGVCIVAVGDARRHKARLQFSRSLFELARWNCRVVEWPLDSGRGDDRLGEIGGARVVCVAGDDGDYPGVAAAVFNQLPPTTLRILAGAPGPLVNELRAAGLDLHLSAGMDVPAFFASVHARLGEVAKPSSETPPLAPSQSIV
jgi:methylmalonyl-CoA mutase